MHAVEMDTAEEGDDGMTQAVLPAEEFDPFEDEEPVDEINLARWWKASTSIVETGRALHVPLVR